MRKDPLLALNQIAQTIFDKKGFNILALDVRGISTLTDYFLIAEGNVDKHVIAIADAILTTLKKEGEKPLHVEGMQQGDWVVIDFLEVVVHLFMPGVRSKYRLEELWQKGEIVDLNLDLRPVEQRGPIAQAQ